MTGSGSAGWLLTPTGTTVSGRSIVSSRPGARCIVSGSARALGRWHVLDSGSGCHQSASRAGACRGIRVAVRRRRRSAGRAPVAAAAAALRPVPPVSGGTCDEGWTRFIFDTWEFPYTRVEADEIRKGGLNERYDVLMFSDDELRLIMGTDQREAGLFPSGGNYPPEYRKGIGTEGVQALREFVRAGGSLVLIDGATSLADTFGIPVRDALKGLSAKEFFAPGSTLRVRLDPSQPLAYGMPRDALVIFFNSVAFDVGNSLSNGNIAVVGQVRGSRPAARRLAGR